MKSFIKRNKSLIHTVVTVMTLWAMTFAASAGDLTARKVFEELQCQPLEILKKTTRLDMLDYWDADSTYRAKNAMEGFSWLLDVKPDYLRVQVSPVSQLEIKLLPDKDKTVVMTLYTIGASPQAADTQVDFYDADLNKLDTNKYLKIPGVKDFFEIPKGSLTKMKEIEELIPFPTIRYSASPDDNDLTATLTVEKFLPVDDWNVVKLFLKPAIKAQWKNRYKF